MNARILLAYSLLSSCGPLVASEWETTRSVALGFTGTDNVEQTAAEQRTVSNYRLRPSVRTSKEGRRIDLDLQGDLDIRHSSESGESRVDPRAFAGSNSELINDRLFFDTDLLITQAGDSDDGDGFEDLALVDPPNDVLRLRLGPEYRYRFDSAVDLTTDYAYDRVFAIDGEAVESTEHRANLGLVRPLTSDRLEWRFTTSVQQIDSSDQTQVTSSDALVGTGLQLLDTLVFNADVGYESNQLQGLSTSGEAIERDERGVIWDVALGWAPSERTRLEIGFGQRFFGDKPRLELSHRTRRGLLLANWTRDLTRFADALDDTGGSSDDAVLQDSDVSDDLTGSDGISLDTTVAQNYRIEERIELIYRLEGRRHALELASAWTQRDSALESDSLSTQWQFRTGVERELTRRTTLALRFDHLAGDIEGSDDDYRENRISALLTLRLR